MFASSTLPTAWRYLLVIPAKSSAWGPLEAQRGRAVLQATPTRCKGLCGIHPATAPYLAPILFHCLVAMQSLATSGGARMATMGRSEQTASMGLRCMQAAQRHSFVSADVSLQALCEGGERGLIRQRRLAVLRSWRTPSASPPVAACRRAPFAPPIVWTAAQLEAPRSSCAQRATLTRRTYHDWWRAAAGEPVRPVRLERSPTRTATTASLLVGSHSAQRTSMES